MSLEFTSGPERDVTSNSARHESAIDLKSNDHNHRNVHAIRQAKHERIHGELISYTEFVQRTRGFVGRNLQCNFEVGAISECNSESLLTLFPLHKQTNCDVFVLASLNIQLGQANSKIWAQLN